VEEFRAGHPRRRDRIGEYERLLDTGAHLRIGSDVLTGCHRPAPPAEAWVNKVDGRKKRVFQYPPADELLLRVVNRLLQPAAAEAASPWCRSFLPGGGARTAFRALLSDPAVDDKAALRLDVRDYFNSIDVADLLARLPEAFVDGPVGALLRAALLDPRVVRGGTVVDGGRKGVMAGTPVAPLLATLYLADLDHEIAACATYSRYSDDIVVLAASGELPALDALVRARLAERRLEVNEAKSAVSAPGEPWDYLGFRYRHAAVGLAPITGRKLKARATRLARSVLRRRERGGVEPGRAAELFLGRTNRRLFRTAPERADFSWATWFLPMLDRADDLGPLDQHVQREARYAATGRRTVGARKLLDYRSLVDAGHLPLVHAFWALQQGPAAYDTLVARRTGLA
jgi:hypothetical protein